MRRAMRVSEHASLDDGLVSAYLCRIAVEVGPLVRVGPGPYGERRFVPITGGRVEGPTMTGVVVP